MCSRSEESSGDSLNSISFRVFRRKLKKKTFDYRTEENLAKVVKNESVLWMLAGTKNGSLI